jgi:hypothetical protein
MVWVGSEAGTAAGKNNSNHFFFITKLKTNFS